MRTRADATAASWRGVCASVQGWREPLQWTQLSLPVPERYQTLDRLGYYHIRLNSMNRISTKRSTAQVPFYLRVRLLRSQAPVVRVLKLGRHRDWHATKLRFPGRVASLAPSRRFLEVTPSRRRTCRVPQASEPGRARGPGPRRPAAAPRRHLGRARGRGRAQ
jgi:hypothetical protein